MDSYLQSSGAYADYPGLDVDVVVDGHVVKVYLAMPYELPVSVPGVRDVAIIHGNSAAEMPIY